MLCIDLRKTGPSNFARLVVCILIWSLFACGGGSSGTGTRRIDGSVLTTSSLPIEGATVSVLETGVTSITDQDGVFSLNTEVPAGQLTLEVSYADQQVHTSVNVDKTTAINVELQIPGAENDRAAAVNEQHLRVKLEGPCAQFFDQGAEVIRQTLPFDSGTRCRIRLELEENNGSNINRRVQLEQRGCRSHSDWERIKHTQTDTSGRATLSFELRASELICEYRVGVISIDTGNVAAFVLLETHGLSALTGDQAGQ